jgi:4'-phosphopantetheinyl transferase
MMGGRAEDDEGAWEAAPPQVHAAHEEVHVWRASCSLPAEVMRALRGLLSEDEAARADRFRFARDRDDFTVARGGLRVILGRYTGRAPGSLRFIYSPYGKPSLDEGAGGVALRFNLSHSGGVALYAVTVGREVGVDVEQVREEMDCVGVADRFFSANEVKVLQSLAPEARTRAFFDCWARKEAYIKARGEGLSLPLDSFDVSLAPGEPAALLRTRGDAAEAARWTLRELSAGRDYAAALAVEGGGWRLRCWRWEAG